MVTEFRDSFSSRAVSDAFWDPDLYSGQNILGHFDGRWRCGRVAFVPGGAALDTGPGRIFKAFRVNRRIRQIAFETYLGVGGSAISSHDDIRYHYIARYYPPGGIGDNRVVEMRVFAWRPPTAHTFETTYAIWVQGQQVQVQQSRARAPGRLRMVMEFDEEDDSGRKAFHGYIYGANDSGMPNPDIPLVIEYAPSERVDWWECHFENILEQSFGFGGSPSGNEEWYVWSDYANILTESFAKPSPGLATY